MQYQKKKIVSPNPGISAGVIHIPDMLPLTLGPTTRFGECYMPIFNVSDMEY